MSAGTAVPRTRSRPRPRLPRAASRRARSRGSSLGRRWLRCSVPPRPSPGGRGWLSWDSRRRPRSARREAGGSPHHSRDSLRWPRSEPQQPLQPASVEARDNLAVHDDDGHRHPPRPRHEFLARHVVLNHVLRGERHPVRRKELFRRVTRLSGARPVDDHLAVGHGLRPPCPGVGFTSRPAKIRRPSVKASAVVVAAPASSGCATRHARRCSRMIKTSASSADRASRTVSRARPGRTRSISSSGIAPSRSRTADRCPGARPATGRCDVLPGAPRVRRRPARPRS